MEMNLEQFAARVLEAAQQAGIAPAELCSGSTESFTARVRAGALEDYQVSDRLSVTLRGRVGERIGTASTQAMDEESIALLIQGVRESAALIENDEQDDILPPDEHYETVCNYSAELDALPAQEKIALAMDIDRLMHEGDARLKADASVVSTAKSTVSMRNTLGLNLSHTSNMIYAYTSALAKEGESAATGFKLLWGYGLKDVDAQRRDARRYQGQRHGRPALHLLGRVLRGQCAEGHVPALRARGQHHRQRVRDHHG